MRVYIDLIEKFCAGDLEPVTFRDQFISLYRADEHKYPPREFDALDGIFARCDLFVPDDALLKKLREDTSVGYLDAASLRTFVCSQLSVLYELDRARRKEGGIPRQS